MHRKKALTIVINYLKQLDDLPTEVATAIPALEAFRDSMPFKLWTDDAVRQAVNQYISEFHRPPTVTDLRDVKYLPSHVVFKTLYNMTAAQWLMENYPNAQYLTRITKYIPYHKMERAEVKRIFQAEYLRLGCPTSVEFNKKREAHIPSWQYICKILDCQKKWSVLLTLCGLETAKKIKDEPLPSIIHNNLEEFISQSTFVTTNLQPTVENHPHTKRQYQPQQSVRESLLTAQKLRSNFRQKAKNSIK